MPASESREQKQAADNTLVIYDSVSLHMWERQLHTITSTYNLPAALFQFPEFSDLQNRSMTALARSYQKECGCTSGSFFMSVTVMILLVFYFGSGGHLSGITFTQAGTFLGITVLCSLFGKLLGLFWARWRLLKLATDAYNRPVRAM